MPAYDVTYIGGFDADRYWSVEKKRANKDINAGKFYFIDVALQKPRYLKYMQQFCNQFHLTYYFFAEDWLGYEGINPMRCYIASMDSAAKVKCGADYKAIIEGKADSCFFAHVAEDTVAERYCHAIASVNDTAIRVNKNGEVFRVKCNNTLYHKFKSLTSRVAEPQMVVGLCVEADGKVSKYKLTSFYSDGEIYYCDTLKKSPVFNDCGAAFYNLALETLRKHPVWKPAQTGNVNVRTWHNVEVDFTEEKTKAN